MSKQSLVNGSNNNSAGEASCLERTVERVMVIGAPVIVVASIFFVYAVFMLHNLLPQLQHTFQKGLPPTENDPNNYVPSVGEIVAVTVVFHVLFLLMFIAFLRSALTPAGHIPDEMVWKNGQFDIPQQDEDKLRDILCDLNMPEDKIKQERAFIQSIPVIERKLKGAVPEKRFCNKCRLYKPDRTHHCKLCQRCVLRMDHHCPWIANCVGYNNYKYFVLFLFYTNLCLIFILGAMFRRLIRTFRPMVSVNIFLKTDLPVLLAYVLALFLCIALVMFFFFHMSLVFQSLTTIEYREKLHGTGDEIRHRWAVAHLKYDRGSAYQNFLHVFGSPWMWFLPIQSNLTGTEGTYTETRRVD